MSPLVRQSRAAGWLRPRRSRWAAVPSPSAQAWRVRTYGSSLVTAYGVSCRAHAPPSARSRASARALQPHQRPIRPIQTAFIAVRQWVPRSPPRTEATRLIQDRGRIEAFPSRKVRQITQSLARHGNTMPGMAFGRARRLKMFLWPTAASTSAEISSPRVDGRPPTSDNPARWQTPTVSPASTPPSCTWRITPLRTCTWRR